MVNGCDPGVVLLPPQPHEADSEHVGKGSIVDQGERIVETIGGKSRIRLEGENIPIGDRRGWILQVTVQAGREENAEVIVHGEGKLADYIAVLPEVSPWTKGIAEVRRGELDGSRLGAPRKSQEDEEET